jgi:hypothetical protein
MAKRDEAAVSGKRICRVLAALCLAVTVSTAGSTAWGAPLNLELKSSPEIASDFVSVSYNSDSHILSVKGHVGEFATSANATVPVANGTFEISASISNAGRFDSGVLTVRGAIPSLGISQATLLSGELNSFGYGDGDAGGILEYFFATSGGSLADDFGPITGVILSQSGFGGSFTQSFGTSSVALASMGKPD